MNTKLRQKHGDHAKRKYITSITDDLRDGTQFADLISQLGWCRLALFIVVYLLFIAVFITLQSSFTSKFSIAVFITLQSSFTFKFSIYYYIVDGSIFTFFNIYYLFDFLLLQYLLSFLNYLIFQYFHLLIIITTLL